MKINVTCVTDGKNHPTITKSRAKKVNVINEIVIITMMIIIIIIMMMMMMMMMMNQFHYLRECPPTPPPLKPTLTSVC